MKKQINRNQPEVKAALVTANLPANVTPFVFGVTALLVYPKFVKATEKTPVKSIFQQAKGKTVHLVDDYSEVAKLMRGLTQDPGMSLMDNKRVYLHFGKISPNHKRRKRDLKPDEISRYCDYH